MASSLAGHAGCCRKDLGLRAEALKALALKSRLTLPTCHGGHAHAPRRVWAKADPNDHLPQAGNSSAFGRPSAGTCSTLQPVPLPKPPGFRSGRLWLVLSRALCSYLFLVVDQNVPN